MTRIQQEERFNELLAKMTDIRRAKNSDYASDQDSLSNLRGCEAMGIPAWVGTLVRMGDKYNRLSQLAKKGQAAVKEESVSDTLLDLAIYALLCLMLYEETQPTTQPR